MRPEASVKEIKGIGDKTADNYKKLGIETVLDLVEYYPRDYERFDEPGLINEGPFGRINTVYAKLCEIPKLHQANSVKVVTATWMDIRGNRFVCVWFNQPYLCKSLHTGEAYVLRGNKTYKGGKIELVAPQIIDAKKYASYKGRLMPIYSLTVGVTRQSLTKTVQTALEGCEFYLKSDIDDNPEIRKEFMSYANAVREIHFPKNEKMAEEARKRIVLEEFFRFFKGISELIKQRENKKTAHIITKNRETERYMIGLPFALTDGQDKAWQEIREDLCSDIPMHRIVQGDVGSGKTVLAFLAMIETAVNGYQAALMAPTAVLANQHYNNFVNLFPDLADRAVLLTGSNTAKEKREIYEKISSGQALIVIGTHAVFQEKVCFKDLMLVITDEQHRFGVGQRHELADKGNEPHVLYMSATPIPRSLAGILYADLKVTLLTEKPKGRKKIHTCVIGAAERNKAYKFIRDELQKGHQAYVICPFVEESELLVGENVTDYSKQMRQCFPEYGVSCMHGRMKQNEKDRIMLDFSDNKNQILVSTTVIEVGVDVPNSTVIMIENAEKFGLAQLHQLRGRVGRGDSESYCILVDGSENEEENKRLKIMNESDDGFDISSKDFKLRGPGDIMGVRQSGNPSFKLADIFRDNELMIKAKILTT